MNPQPKKVVAAVDDLLFGTKISEAARRAGVAVEFVRDDRALLEKAQSGPAMIILDLNCAAVKPLQSIGNLKADPELKKIYLVGYVSHVQAELKQKAQEAGCDVVLARSAFSQNLPDLLERL